MIIEGLVKRGRGLGHTIGFPTANVEVGEELSVKLGVYRSRVSLLGSVYDAVTHVGTNPTVGGNTLRSESFIFSFEGDIYGEMISVELLDFVRGEQHFDSVETLVEQIRRDVEQVERML